MLRITSLLASLLLGAGCSLTVDVAEHQCEEQSDCSGISGTECVDFACVTVAPETQFGCREKPWKVLDQTKLIEQEFTLIALSTNNLIEGSTMYECNTLFDRDCDDPVETQVSDAEGTARFELPEGFRGHIFAPGTSNYAPVIIQLFPPPDSEDPNTLKSPVNRANFSEIYAAAALVGVEVESGTGAFIFTAHDCFRELLEGVQLSTFPELPSTAAAYLSESGLPDPTLTATGPAGTGAIVNLPPGNVTIKAVHDDVGVIFEQTILVVEDTLTAGLIIPSP